MSYTTSNNDNCFLIAQKRKKGQMNKFHRNVCANTEQILMLYIELTVERLIYEPTHKINYVCSVLRLRLKESTSS